jgi:predicted nucleic acid-binding protein
MAISSATQSVFFDTNVLLYLLSPDPRKADIAEHLVSLGGTISVQVLNEFTQVAGCKFKMSASDVVTVLSTLRRALKVASLTEATHDLGIELSAKYSLSVYDAMIVASGVSCRATTLFSEDMQSGLLVEKQLRIINPFAPDFKLPS